MGSMIRRTMGMCLVLTWVFAASVYAHILRLDPEDIDTRVHMALVQTELGNFVEAMRYLEEAKNKATDERIIRQLDGYISKIQQAE